MPPPSQQGAACSHAGSQEGAHAGAQAGAAHGAGAGGGDPHDRNSMNDGRRQLLKLPMQLLQPGAAARLSSAIDRHNARAIGSSPERVADGKGGRFLASGVVAADATKTLAHESSARGGDVGFFPARSLVVVRS